MPKTEKNEGNAVVDTSTFPAIDENGFVFIESKEQEDGSICTVYAKKVPEGCDKRVIVTKNGETISDSTSFKRAAFIQEWTLNGIPYRSELMGGN